VNQKFFEEINKILLGKEEVVKLATVAILAKGHILFQDVPGVGKTLLAKALAKAMDLSFQRIQFTSDMMPADIIGVNLFNQKIQEFEFHPGPIFANLLLADEINRATPKTQSALLEAMQEGQVTVDRKPLLLPQPFFVFATQNPLEFSGTYPLPESQLDRFTLCISLGYPSKEVEEELMEGGGREKELENLKPIIKKEEILNLQKEVEKIYVSKKILSYVRDLAAVLRSDKRVFIGPSPRALIQLISSSKAMGFLSGRDYVIPDDIYNLFIPVMEHRVILKDPSISTKDILLETLDKTENPV
jgi:MoxR-like ATPase